MTQEEKQLLLKDLCARLPYGVIVIDNMGRIGTLDNFGFSDRGYPYFGTAPGMIYNTADIKSYLRPMSSMTDEEEDELIDIINGIKLMPLLPHSEMTWYGNPEIIDWLNAHYFDYRGLIEKGLALEAPKEMYKTE